MNWRSIVPPVRCPMCSMTTALRTAQANVVDAQRKVADLAAVFTPDFAKVKRATAELVALQTASRNSAPRLCSASRTITAEAIRKEKLLETTYNSQAREVMGQDEKAIQYNILKRDVDSNRQLYDTMLQQLKQSSIASALHASNVRVVDPATLPQKPIWPNYKILAPLGLIFGLLTGLCAIVVSERMDRRLRHPGEIQLWANVPELGTIPNASVDSGRRVRVKSAEGCNQATQEPVAGCG